MGRLLLALPASAVIIGGTIALFLALAIGGWIGFIGSDDVTYALGGYGWLDDFPYVGGHGTIRETIAIPIALSFQLFGENEAALVLPSLLYTVVLVGAIVLAVTRTVSSWAGASVGLLLATSPLLTVQASIAGVDAVEALFLFASMFCFLRALHGGGRPGPLIAAGALAGFGFLTRETAAFLVVFYGLLFLVGYGMPRMRYWFMSVGFLAVWGMELVYLAVMTGDPFYRLNISLHHDSSISRAIDLAGNVIVHPLIDPLLLLLVNQEFALLFWALIPAVLWLWLQRRRLGPETTKLLVVTAGLGAVWIAAAGAATSLLPLNPRYFLVCVVSACILVGTAIGDAASSYGGRRIAAAFALLAILAGNVGGMLAENRDYMFGERVLVTLAATTPETIYTDPMTHHRAKLLLRWASAEDRVKAESPPRNAYYFYNPPRADMPNRLVAEDHVRDFQPRAGWSLAGRWEPTTKLSGWILTITGLGPLLPDGLHDRLIRGHPGVALYRALDAPTASQ